jgi:hypothetical protein
MLLLIMRAVVMIHPPDLIFRIIDRDLQLLLF